MTGSLKAGKLKAIFVRMILVLIMLTVTWNVTAQQQEELTWDGNLHQLVVVKATKLMPIPLQRQILRNRHEILAGALAGLKDNAALTLSDDKVVTAFNQLVNELQSETPFKKICYQLGYMSTVISEHSSPLRGIASNPAIARFRDFVWTEAKSFPLVISRDGEGFLQEHSLAGYLDYQRQRDSMRSMMILNAVKDKDNAEWHDQRSLPYGIATLCYNDMVLDTARLWLLAWEMAGGSIADATYFPKSGESVYR